MMQKSLLVLMLMASIASACQTHDKDKKTEKTAKTEKVQQSKKTKKKGNKVTQADVIIAAEDKASPVGQKILKNGRIMALETKEIVRGSCWDYIHTVYNRSGYPQKKRHTVHKGTKAKGPYAKADKIQAGDWLYYINHSYHGVEHSGIFVDWVDQSKNIALILSYGGERRNKPGRYRNYDLSNVYTIIRAKD